MCVWCLTSEPFYLWLPQRWISRQGNTLTYQCLTCTGSPGNKLVHLDISVFSWIQPLFLQLFIQQTQKANMEGLPLVWMEAILPSSAYLALGSVVSVENESWARKLKRVSKSYITYGETVLVCLFSPNWVTRSSPKGGEGATRKSASDLCCWLETRLENIGIVLEWFCHSFCGQSPICSYFNHEAGFLFIKRSGNQMFGGSFYDICLTPTPYLGCNTTKMVDWKWKKKK